MSQDLIFPIISRLTGQVISPKERLRVERLSKKQKIDPHDQNSIESAEDNAAAARNKSRHQQQQEPDDDSHIDTFA
ncbi:hypothetical protein DBZ36_03660 [Alginatibacterium sediminis]|uniref:Uncharacterized protein n=1 Tax=Alginatibacterium sediminis TaxID=2164068 RepID=A0A420EFU1_9ALTE|nr:hypothetical protein [Alginatibacterium sediminis]RKF19572.1 hypothetical protein DBZ36_03660 [Alginatibacterium sediminis]